MSFSYDPSIPTESDYIRFALGDTFAQEWSLQDEEIAFCLGVAGDRDEALILCAKALLPRILAVPSSKSLGPLSISYRDSEEWAGILQSIINSASRAGKVLMNTNGKKLFSTREQF
jgi:hypothetical protein